VKRERENSSLDSAEFLLVYTKGILKENQNTSLSPNKMSHTLHSMLAEYVRKLTYFVNKEIYLDFPISSRSYKNV